MKTPKQGFNKTRQKYLNFFLGTASEEEKNELFNSEEFIESLHSKWEEEASDKLKQTPFNKEIIQKRIVEEISNPGKSIPGLPFVSFFRKYAAIFIIGILLGASILYFGLYKDGFLSLQTLTVITNSENINSDIILPDGSKVVLNTHTKLSYPKRFGSRTRSVELEGEAFFDVVHNEKKPFLVTTPEIKIEVLGTRFNLRSFTEDNFSETSLLSGKIRISRKNPITKKIQSVILTPNHKAIFIKNEERFILDKIDSKKEIVWINGSLSIENETVDVLVEKLIRRYDVKISLTDDRVGKYRISMRIDDESLDEVLIILEKTLPLTYQKSETGIKLYSTEK